MNDLRDLVDILDGLCIENTGFMIVDARKWGASLIDGDFWNLKVQGYSKEIADSTSEDPISTLTLVERIENKYNEKKWKVLKVEELEDNMYNLTIKKIMIQEDSKNEENNDPEREQVEAEE